jgi:regulator of sigma E protease
MNETLLTLVVFILAFGGMVLIHEFGHYIVARWAKIEVEEFGIGLPTPGALTLWSNKGHLLLDDGGRVEIPANFKFPGNWNEFLDQQVKLTVDRVDDRLVMRTIESIPPQDPKHVMSSPMDTRNAYAPRSGSVTPEQDNAGQGPGRRVLRAGKQRGEVELFDVVTEVHPGTRFTLNWLPLGGFVRPKGENDPNVPGGLAAASPWKRLAVLVAGPLMNLLTAALIYSLIFSRVGVPDTSRVLVASVVEGGPAQQAGFEAGDIFVSGNGQTIGSYEDLRLIVDANENKPVLFVVDRAGEPVELTATPQMNAQEQRIMIGVGLGEPLKKADSPLETLRLGTEFTYLNIRALVALPAQMIRGTVDSEQSRLVGLKGIYDVMEQTVRNDVEASTAAPTSTDPFGNSRTLLLIASLSISLGLFNLFPFPALDGGRILFVLPELIFRRRVSPQLENMVHAAGMAFLLLLMIYINVMDFVNPINITIP